MQCDVMQGVDTKIMFFYEIKKRNEKEKNKNEKLQKKLLNPVIFFIFFLYEASTNRLQKRSRPNWLDRALPVHFYVFPPEIIAHYEYLVKNYFRVLL